MTPTPTLCSCCPRPATWDCRYDEGDSDHYWFVHIAFCDEHKAQAFWIYDATRIEPPTGAVGTDSRAPHVEDGAGGKECVL